MGVKSSLAGKGMDASCGFLNEGKNNGRGRKRNRRRQRIEPLVQTLFRVCKEVFSNAEAGFVPSPDDVKHLTSVLDSLKPADVGLTPNMPYFRSTTTKGAPPITYLHLFESDKFSMGIFCLPESAVIPLHNHPGMTVFTKVEVSRLAKLQVNAELSAPCSTSILYPAAGGNMHCFTAITACAVLDVLGPPYCDADGRHCTYYLEHATNTLSVDGTKELEDKIESHAWLEEIEKPDDLVCGLQQLDYHNKKDGLNVQLLKRSEAV
ncbi:Plant cysteine oxidase 2-like protein [Drosera capensis]